MQGVVIFLLIAIVVYLVYLLVVKVIAPIAGVLAVVTTVVGLIYGFITAVKSFSEAFKEFANPYRHYVDQSPVAAIGLRRNYFFGPGFRQMVSIVGKTWSLQLEYLRTLWGKISQYIKGKKWYIKIWIQLFYFVTYVAALVLGSLWIFCFSAILLVVLTIGQIAFFTLFTILWTADRISLLIRSIHSRCPYCKHKSLIPLFVCPDCGAQHKKLVPGPYGVLRRKCTCGKKLSTTYFNGRSRYEAKCPFCETDLAASDARQYSIQLVGGISTGKTTYLAAFWNEYRQRMQVLQNLKMDLIPIESFNELEYWFQSGASAATVERNAVMYSIIHRFASQIPIQVSLYDIAGEAFNLLSIDRQQQQFSYCEGLLFVVDPSFDPLLTSQVFANFIGEFTNLKGKHIEQLSRVPVAVLITKSDLVANEIGLAHIHGEYQRRREIAAASNNGAPDYAAVRNEVCRRFLHQRGYSNSLNQIDAAFHNVQYVSVL